ncbi:MAG: Hsp20/alpha crystallin family protein [Spirochaetales bacterium]|nr:Hsp20/alpha crystallin family protein [Spirochaetales bacterium]
MAITKWKKENQNDPWTELQTLQNEINDLFNVDRYPSSSGLFDRNVSPAMDVFEDEQAFNISCELPGIEQEEVEISIAANVLTIKGSKNDEKEANSGKYYRRETWSGTFQRTLSLPVSVDINKIEAELKNGILLVTIPKTEEAKPKQISVKVK